MSGSNIALFAALIAGACGLFAVFIILSRVRRPRALPPAAAAAPLVPDLEAPGTTIDAGDAR
ncbi:hypothetical protein ACF3M1_12460 [Luteimonas sp. WGS1318]|uniref:hypothetical protein n=1 Tax=Luteimonas sp. WGS1318 TaxID=3366815 RepID=UPI00372D3085